MVKNNSPAWDLRGRLFRKFPNSTCGFSGDSWGQRTEQTRSFHLSQKVPQGSCGGGGERWGRGRGTRGRSHANAAVTIRPGASEPPGGRGWNKALAFSTCEKPAFLGREAARAPPPPRHSHSGPHRALLQLSARRFASAFLLTRAMHTKCRYFPKRRL